MQYKVLSTINHSGIKLEPGNTVDMSEQEAASLLAGGALERADKPFSCGGLTIKTELKPGA